MKNEDEITRSILESIRTITNQTDTDNQLLLEDDDKNKSKAIAITDDPIFGTNVLSSQIEAFRSAVESGAQFSKPDKDHVENSPLIYQPSVNGKSGDNLIFGGTIPCLGNLQWQFKLRTNTGDGCFVWVDDENGLILTKSNLQILNKLYGFYENWREEWNTESTDLEKLANHINDRI
jgi:hypothetical protein